MMFMCLIVEHLMLMIGLDAGASVALLDRHASARGRGALLAPGGGASSSAQPGNETPDMQSIHEYRLINARHPVIERVQEGPIC